ncbi:TetR/AcrR family transcriptional regulator, partial [Nocardia abscessus]|uniref:TetR/AcrR family transcriptional regulator n=1 Tax=Nocardia abscessus TaxID=120957 RepID=UPI002456A503
MTKPLRRDAARNREKLLRSAAEVFTEQGLEGSLEEIARRAGVSIGTLYNHFPTRDMLIDALLPPRLAAMDAELVYATDLFDGVFAGTFAERFVRVLRGIAADPSVTVGDI